MGLARQNWYSACISRSIAREEANKSKGIPIPGTNGQNRPGPKGGPNPPLPVQKERKHNKAALRKELKEY